MDAGLQDSMFEVVARAKTGDDDAVRVIWDKYFPQVVRLAGNRLAGTRRGAADEEDVAISVMESFFRAAQAGRFPDLNDSDGIWRLLSSMTRRKVVDYVRRSAARPAVGESALDAEGLASLTARDPTPAMIAVVADEVDRLLHLLPEKYHDVALKKLECLTVPEIARACGVHISTIERRLRIIREVWLRGLEGE